MKKQLRKVIVLILIIALIAAFSACGATGNNEPVDGRYDLLFGASVTAGMAYQWVTAFCDVINNHSDIVVASAITTLGSSENINLLACNEIDAGISTTIVASSAARGEADWEGKPVAGLEIINFMYADYCYVCTAEDSPINSISDLKGKRVNIGEKGGGIYTGMLQVLQALGIEETEYFDSYYLSVPDAVSAIQDGSLDALFVYGSSTNSALMELQASRAGIKVIGFTQEEIDIICENNSLLMPTVMEVSYPGVPPIKTVGGAMCFVGTDRLPLEVSYELCRILDEYHDEILAITKWAETSTMENTSTLHNDIIPLSEGTQAYLQERGLS